MTTKLIVIRHAAPVSNGHADDALKTLSKEGRQAQRKLAEKLKAEGAIPKLILTSPLIRAVQSADILGEILQVPVQEEPALGEEFNEKVLLDHIPSPEHEETLALVGHMPTLAAFVEKLVGKRVLPDGIGKSGAVILEFEDQIGWGKASYQGYLQGQ